ncbi:T9SS type A sorting domain-containing protein [bacterium]|nr:T9SS type A sorting domain-containing protein [bacterium]
MTWNSFSLTDTFLFLTGLFQCTVYEAQIFTRCDTGLTAAFRSLTFTTSGCGFCREGIYCLSKSNDATEDWIAGVEVGPLSQISGSDDGYGDFTGNATDLWPGVSYSIKLTPGYAATAFNEYWKAWIDYNQDGDFDEVTEKIFDSGTTSDTVVTGQFAVPFSAKSGPTRLRISMRFSLAPDPCQAFPFGEVEDYCVDLRGLVSKEETLKLPAVSLFPNPVESKLNIYSNEIMESIEIISMNGLKQVIDPLGKREIQVPMDHLSAGMYAIRIRVGGKWVVRKVLVK